MVIQAEANLESAHQDRRGPVAAKSEPGRDVRATGPYRQGDVLLVPCAAVPRDARAEPSEGGRIVVARGELTGHAHVMAADRVCRFRDDGTGSGYLRVDGSEPVALSHEEHAPLMVPPGSYRVVRQREYQPSALPRMVID